MTQVNSPAALSSDTGFDFNEHRYTAPYNRMTDTSNGCPVAIHLPTEFVGYVPSPPVTHISLLFNIIIPVLLMVFALLGAYRINLLRKVSWR